MLVKLLAIGTKMPNWVNEATHMYLQRLKSAPFKIELHEIPLAKRTKNASKMQLLKQESHLIKARIQMKNDHIVLLDGTGKNLTTQHLAQKLKQWQLQITSVAFIIGGPDGVDSSIKQMAAECICLSCMTLPHALVRVMLTEQLYRAHTILTGHPYHK